MLSERGGKSMLAMDIFALVIEHLKKNAEETIIRAGDGLQDDDILWVITVPAIWSDSAKQFMREAGEKAGIEKKRLKLVLEPEAAAIFVNNQAVCKITKSDGSQVFERFPEGQKYVVADLGGGTADLSVHEILEDGNIRELQSANGDAYGGILVDKAYINFLQRIFGEKVMNRFSEQHPVELLELQHEFEIRKKSFKLNMQGAFRLRLPIASFIKIIEEEEGIKFKEKENQIQNIYGEKIKFITDKMLIAPDIVQTFFDEAVEGIITFIETMRKDENVIVINVLVLVGGFSESPYVKDRIIEKFSDMRVIVPLEPSLAVLKGAVMLGHKPKAITERIARFSYGFSFGVPFEEGVHPEELKTKQGETYLCTSVFKKLIEKGQILKGDKVFVVPASYTCHDSSDRYGILVTELYRSSEKDPKYTADGYGCELVGSLIKFPPLLFGWPKRTLFLEGLIVGESEFTVLVMNVNNGHVMAGKLEFLGEQKPEILLGDLHL